MYNYLRPGNRKPKGVMVMRRYVVACVLASAVVLSAGCAGSGKSDTDAPSATSSESAAAIHVKVDGPTTCNPAGGEATIRVTPYRGAVFNSYRVVVSLFKDSTVVRKDVTSNVDENGGLVLPFSCKGEVPEHYRVVVTGTGDHKLYGRGADAFDVFSVPKSSH